MKRQQLGQHFLLSKDIAKKIVNAARIQKNDTVLEIGTGYGILTDIISKKANKVITIETDAILYDTAKIKFKDIKNVTLLHKDAFKQQYTFDVIISNLPYSKSKIAIEWLAQSKFKHGVIMVQKEFAQKLTSTKSRRAISIIANHCFDIKKVMNVNCNNFYPKPKIDSIVLRLEQKNTLPLDVIHSVNLLYSYKRKSLSGILKQFKIQSDSKKRLDELDVEEIISIARQI